MRSAGRTLLNFAFLFALTVWGGMVFFFTFINTPVVFADLDRDTAARLLGDLFPRYFAVQLICIAVALAVVGARLIRGGRRGVPAVAAALLTVALAIALYANFGLLPRMAKAQARVPSFVTTPREDPARRAYGALHGQAMVLNAIAALLGGATLLATAFEPRLLAEKAEGRGRKAEGRERAGAEQPAATSEARPAQART